MSNGVDLSGLDQFNSASFLEDNLLDAANSGRPLLVSLDQISPDPDQPRQDFNPERLEELAASIKERGVKSPISVKPANGDGVYFINHGERRWRAARVAGLAEIPVFIDDDHTGYDQVIENIQREGLTPLEIAHFVERRLEAGDKKGQIAKLLGKPASYVSDHAIFFQLPDCVRDLYDSGRCRTIQALASLYRLYKDFPDEVASFLRGERTISNNEVRTLAAELKERKAVAPVEAPGELVEAEGSVEPVAVEEKEESLVRSGGSDEVDSIDDMGQDLYRQFEDHLRPVIDYLEAVSDPDFREVAGSRLFKLAEKFGG